MTHAKLAARFRWHLSVHIELAVCVLHIDSCWQGLDGVSYLE